MSAASGIRQPKRELPGIRDRAVPDRVALLQDVLCAAGQILSPRAGLPRPGSRVRFGGDRATLGQSRIQPEDQPCLTLSRLSPRMCVCESARYAETDVVDRVGAFR
jgi:hypothetical protein